MVFILLAGVVFMFLEKDSAWNFRDSWYFAVVTLSTVGYGVLTPSNDTTRFFVVIYLVFGAVYFVFTIRSMQSLLNGSS